MHRSVIVQGGKLWRSLGSVTKTSGCIIYVPLNMNFHIPSGQPFSLRRHEYSARSVISDDSKIDISDIGIPKPSKPKTSTHKRNQILPPSLPPPPPKPSSPPSENENEFETVYERMRNGNLTFADRLYITFVGPLIVGSILFALILFTKILDFLFPDSPLIALFIFMSTIAFILAYFL